MNLHQLARGTIRAVNPEVRLSIRVSTGNATDADFKEVPSYAAPVWVTGQVQPLMFRDIQQLDALNLQGTRRKIFINGQINGLIRPDNKGGDLITFPDDSVWLVAMVLEGWTTAGWCVVAATLQNGS